MLRTHPGLAGTQLGLSSQQRLVLHWLSKVILGPLTLPEAEWVGAQTRFCTGFLDFFFFSLLLKKDTEAVFRHSRRVYWEEVGF
jgi:hypothetical protein